MSDEKNEKNQGASHSQSAKSPDDQVSPRNDKNGYQDDSKPVAYICKLPSREVSCNVTTSQPLTRRPTTNPTTSKPPSKMLSNTPSDPKTSSKMSNKPISPETSNFAVLQEKLQGEVARAVEMWRKGMVQGTLESQNERIESFIKQLEDDNFGTKDKTSCSILAELKRENDQLRNELEEMRKLDVNDITVERLQELQHDNKNLRNIISKLQEEVQEKNTIHHRKIRDQQDIIRKSQANADSSESAVNKLKTENQELKAKVAKLIKISEEEVDDVKKAMMTCQPCPAIDLVEKLSKAEHRSQIACLELNLKRKHRKKVPLHSVKSLEDIACVWNQQVSMLKMLLKKEKEMNVLKDRLDMFLSNIEILKDENSELNARVAAVRDEMKRFRENPMKPSEQVVKNVNLLLHMEKIDASLAEKAVQLDKNEKDLKREQLRVREILIRVEELRRENRHLTRRIQKDAAKKAYETQSAISGVSTGESSSSCTNSEQLPSINLDPVYGTTGEDIDAAGVEPTSDGTDPDRSDPSSHPEDTHRPACPSGPDARYEPGCEGAEEPALESEEFPSADSTS